MDTKVLKTEKKIAKFMEHLAGTILPKQTPKKAREKIASYCHNLLKSSFPVHKVTSSEERKSISTAASTVIRTGKSEIEAMPPSILISKKITQLYKGKKKKTKEQIFERVNVLMYNLTKSSLLKKKAAILSVLNSLSRDRKQTEEDNSKSRLLEILEIREKQRRDKGMMEVEGGSAAEVRIFDGVEGRNMFVGSKKKRTVVDVKEMEERRREDKENLIMGIIELLQTGKSCYFEEKNDGNFHLRIKLKVQTQVLNLILKIAQASRMVIFVRRFYEESKNFEESQVSLTKSAFLVPLSSILEEFDNFILTIKNSKQVETSIFGDKDKSMDSKFISVITLYTILQEPLMKMENTALIIDSVRNLKDVHLLSSLDAYASSGNNRLRLLSRFFIRETIKPLTNFLLGWLNEGEVKDQNSEFFIRQILKKVKFWENDCEVLYNKIPSLIGQEMAEIIFKIGTLVRFMKNIELTFSKEDIDYGQGEMEIEYGLGQIEMEKINAVDLNFVYIQKEDMKAFLYEHYLKHARMLIKCYLRESQFFKNFDFLHKTFFMRNGDFFDSLIHELDPLLSKKASEVYFHEVMPLFRSISEKSSIRNIGFIKGKGWTKIGADLLDRFGLKFLEKSDGDKGWDIFCLEFKFSEKMRCVITEEIELKLQRLSHFLIRLRRLYYKMNQIWKLQKKVLKAQDILPSAYQLIVKCNLMRTHMSQFITNINSYVFYEVIASEYQKFIGEVNNSKDLQELRKSCCDLMNNLLQRCFLQKSENFDKKTKPKVNLDFINERLDGVRNSNFGEAMKTNGSSSIQESISNLLDFVDKFSTSFLKIHGFLYKGDGRMNKYFPIRPSTKLISEVWEEYDNEYYHFLRLIECSCDDYGLEASSFKFDFNYFHVNQYEKKIGKRYFEKIANNKRVILEQDEKSDDEDNTNQNGGHYFQDI